MKTKVYNLVRIISFILFITSCEQDVNINKNNETQKVDDPLQNVECKDGILVFKSRDDFYHVSNYFNSKPAEIHFEWAENLGFISQKMIFEEINKAEDEFDKIHYDHLNQDLTIDELNYMGIFEDHSEIYKHYLKKGFIKEVNESDGSVSYEPTVVNPALMSVLNEKGYVVVNDTILNYTSHTIKLITDGDYSKINALSSINKSDNTNKVLVIKFPSTKLKGCGHNWDYPTQEKKDGNRKRVQLIVRGNQGTEGLCGEPAVAMGVVFYVEGRGQHKNIWGNWKYTNNYHPIDWIEGSWNYCFKTVQGCSAQYICSVDDNDSFESPLFYTDFPWSGKTNHFTFTLEPDGWWYAPSGWFMDECEVYHYSFELKADGVSNLTATR